MEDKKILRTSELVLQVKRNTYNATEFPLSDWERYLNVLCSNRNYQREAIKTAIEYLISKKYETIESLIEENFYKNDSLRDKYVTIETYYQHIQLPNKKYGCIDLATGTGKSYVIYGIAQIAMGLGIVDKVLVLGPPSTTIEKGLTEKFNKLSSWPELREAIPASSKCKSVEIINANQTITNNSICVENINAVYSGTNSSIKDSLTENGERCLVLNDEIHHAYNKTTGGGKANQSLKKWKEFLLDVNYNFKYILGFTGTAYIENDYFNDVIYRYSLKAAINDGFVKTIDYIEKNNDENENEKFQKVLSNHQKNKEIYNSLKPLTILVTRDIREAKQLKTRLVEFLSKFTIYSKAFLSEKKVLRVTSDPEDKENVLKLPFVDDKDDPTEWIISVAMLTEGWDVKNVFQIVPMEEKAFNSKLLIAQVLGRGLRVPEGYPKASVTVYNHARWSSSISYLVQEVLESETILRNSILSEGERSKYHFTLYNISYNKTKEERANINNKLYKYKDYIELESEVSTKESEISYINIGENRVPFKQKYEIRKDQFLVSDIIDKIEDAFKTREYERFVLNIVGEEYSSEKLPSRDVIEKYIRNSMEKAGITGDYLGKANKDRVMKAFNTLLRKASKTVVIKKSPEQLISLPTNKKNSESISLSNLRGGASIFYSDDFEIEIVDEDSRELIGKLKSEREYRSYLINCNTYNFKTPVDLVFTNGDPEEKFVTCLTENANCAGIAYWLKSNNQGFYSIEYSIREGSHSSIHAFSPDFFIVIRKNNKEYISVVEIKMDGDASERNKQKYKYAKEHFAVLNEELDKEEIEQHYMFNFLSPQNYTDYFKYVNDGRLIEGKFKSALDILLEENSTTIEEIEEDCEAGSLNQ
jgi:type III restriction enzyme